MEDKAKRKLLWGLALTIIVAEITLIIVGWVQWHKRYYFFGKDNDYSKECIEDNLRTSYGEENFKILKKECVVKKEDDHYKFTVHFLMSDDNGMQFDAYQYEYGEKRNSGRLWNDYYFSARDDLADRRIENAVKNQVDLSQYRTWDQIKENEDAADFTITYDGTNAFEPAEAAARIFEANREVANSANVISVIQDTEGNEIYRFNYSSLKEDLEKVGIDINNIFDVHKYVEEKLVSCDSALKSM